MKNFLVVLVALVIGLSFQSCLSLENSMDVYAYDLREYNDENEFFMSTTDYNGDYKSVGLIKIYVKNYTK